MFLIKENRGSIIKSISNMVSSPPIYMHMQGLFPDVGLNTQHLLSRVINFQA